MKRSRLERKTELRADPESTRAWRRRSQDAARERERAGTTSSGAPRARPRSSSIPAAVRAAVIERAGGHCEARLPGCSDRRLACHHRMREGQGGPSTVENLVYLCSDCHTGSPAAVHRNVAWAYSVGLLIRSTDGPPKECWTRALLTM